MSAYQPEREKAIGSLMPLIDIAFLILIFFLCLPFRELDARMAAFLPKRGFAPDADRPPEKLTIKVHIVGRDEAPRPWGAAEVPAPTRVLYRFADGRTTGSLDDVFAHIRRLQRGAEGLAYVRGEIKAGPRVQHKYAIAVLNRFAEARIRDVDFYGARLPSERDLLARTMRYPGRR